MATKYDTNPLDPEFPGKVKAAAADGGPTRVFRDGYAGTSQFDPAAAAESQPTMRFDSQQAYQYQQPHQFRQAAQAPLMGVQADLANLGSVISRKVERVGLPENVLIAAPYIPWYIGLVAGLILLFITPKTETKVRFHAAQGLAAHLGIIVVSTMLGFVGRITDLADAANVIFTLVTSIMLAVFAIKAYRGKPVHIESVEGTTNWLEDKISPSSVNR